jgi:hypothetical protein
MTDESNAVGTKRSRCEDEETASGPIKCTVKCECGNWARIGHDTCNGCRPVSEVDAEKKKNEIARKEEEEEERQRQSIIDGLPSNKCPCGSFSRHGMPFEDFEWTCRPEHKFGKVVALYKKLVAKVAKDPLCNACNLHKARASERC